MTSSYIALARKWRPSSFSDIVGQGPVVRTLMNAIRSQRVHHAYLLTGSRGIGKTSIARILAKTIRCTNTRWENEFLFSCDDCSSCKEVSIGNGVDVIEIDGASNNGVDAIREIRESSKFLPSSGNKKIYIVDEVHMLTTAAFNALLKTLEEPPAHVLFILATTEPHKIPATILSRCQRFDLKRVNSTQVQQRLSEISKAENITIEAQALHLIAQASEGSMRDALSLFDQIIAYAGNKITLKEVRDSIGWTSTESILKIISALFLKDPSLALQTVQSLYETGVDFKQLTKTLIEFLHASILIKVSAQRPDSSELSTEEWHELTQIAQHRSLEEIELFFQVFCHGMDWIARAPQPKIVLEVLLIKCATAEALYSSTNQIHSGGHQPPVKSAPLTATVSVESKPAIKTETFNTNTSWESFIAFVKPKKPLLSSVLEHASCEKFPKSEFDAFVVGFRPEDSLFKEQLQSKTYTDQILILTKEYFGVSKKIIIESNTTSESLAQKNSRQKTEVETQIKTAASHHPLITEAQSLFGGELGPVELISTPEGSHNARI